MAQANRDSAFKHTADQRVFKKNAQWYFHTHNASTKGPYLDKQQAFWALAKHIRQQASSR